MTTTTIYKLPEEEIFNDLEATVIGLIANEDPYDRAEMLKRIFAYVEEIKSKFKAAKESSDNFRSRMVRAEVQNGKLETELKTLKGEI